MWEDLFQGELFNHSALWFNLYEQLGEKEHGLWRQTACVQFSAQPLSSCDPGQVMYLICLCFNFLI